MHGEVEHYYSNMAQIRGGPFDIRLAFYEVIPIEPSVKQPELRCTIAMSPLHFKEFVDAAANQLKAYEGMFGVISPEPLVRAQAAATMATAKSGQES